MTHKWDRGPGHTGATCRVCWVFCWTPDTDQSVCPGPARKLTKADVSLAMEDSRRGGSVGYSECDWAGFPKRLRSKGDGIVVREANRQGWTFLDLVIWVDSKYGRWFWDELYGCKDPIGAARCVTLDWLTPGERLFYEPYEG